MKIETQSGWVSVFSVHVLSQVRFKQPQSVNGYEGLGIKGQGKLGDTELESEISQLSTP